MKIVNIKITNLISIILVYFQRLGGDLGIQIRSEENNYSLKMEKENMMQALSQLREQTAEQALVIQE